VGGARGHPQPQQAEEVLPGQPPLARLQRRPAGEGERFAARQATQDAEQHDERQAEAEVGVQPVPGRAAVFGTLRRQESGDAEGDEAEMQRLDQSDISREIGGHVDTPVWLHSA
jgi:hypothetical protein